MQNETIKDDSFDESDSLQVIREMIQVSHKKIKNDGILFIVWGWIMFYTYLGSYLQGVLVMTYSTEKVLKYSRTILGLAAIVFTLYYIWKYHRKVRTYIGISLRYVWISLIVCLSLTNMVIFNVLHQVNFELQHPVFMIFIAFAIVVTGGILRYRMIIIGGLLFGILAYVSSYFPLQSQLIFEAAAWLIAFVIPGHFLFAKRNK